jgi:HicB family
MELTPYADRVRQELLTAADAAGPEGRATAERLIAPLDSAIRLTLLSALSAAADEITQDMAPGSVEVRLRGLEPRFVVAAAPADSWSDAPGAMMAQPPVADDDAATARINFRPPEQLKARIDAAAAAEGLSVNAWLVRAVSAVLDRSGRPGRARPSSSGGQSFTGWVR